MTLGRLELICVRGNLEVTDIVEVMRLNNDEIIKNIREPRIEGN